MFLSIEILGVQCQRSVNEIENALVMPVEDPASNNILHSTLEVCNTCGHQKKLKFHLIVYMCSTFRKLNIDSIGS
jgi:hypothetical protein